MMTGVRAQRVVLGALALSGLAVLVLVVGPACSDAVSHIYTGRPYDTARDCLGATQSIDVVKGSDTSFTCDAACLYNADEGGVGYVVSSECAPYPLFYSVNPADPECVKALAAANRGDVCFDDGGSTNPPPADAGTPVDANKTD